jgi:hypothetical protein
VSNHLVGFPEVLLVEANIIAEILEINGDSQFIQPPLKVAEVWLQVADEQRRHAGSGYDGRVVCVEGRWDLTPGGWRTASACCTWLWWPRRLRRGLTRRGSRVTHRMKRQETSIQPQLPQLACLNEITSPSGRTLRTSDFRGVIKLYGLCKTGNLGSFACRGGLRFKWCRRLWQRRRRLRR